MSLTEYLYQVLEIDIQFDDVMSTPAFVFDIDNIFKGESK